MSEIKKSSWEEVMKEHALEQAKEISEDREFDTGAKRDDNSNKPFIHNLKGYTRMRFGFHMTTGSNKYGDSNWEKGMPIPSYLESIDRHLAQYMDGDRSEDHLSAIIFGAQGCMMEEKKEGVKADHYFKKQ